MEVLHITCNMCTHDLPDMYALSPWALCIHIRQITSAHVTTITCKCAYVHMYAICLCVCVFQCQQWFNPLTL